MKYKILIIVAIFLCSNLMAQFPVGKNIKNGEKEIKTLMQNKGFHYLKTEKDISDNAHKIYMLYFSEEFTIALWVNEYENIYLVNFCSAKLKTIENVLKKFEFEKWAKTEESTSSSGHDITHYKYKTYNIEYDKSDTYKLFQFLIRADE